MRLRLFAKASAHIHWLYRTSCDIIQPVNEPPPDYIMKYMDYPEDQGPAQAVYAYAPIELVARWAAEKGGLKALPAPEKEGE